MTRQLSLAVRVQVQELASVSSLSLDTPVIPITNAPRSSGVILVDNAADTILDVGTVVTQGWLIMRNRDNDNFVKFGPESGGVMVSFGRMNPDADGNNAGEPALLRLEPGAVVRLRADTAPCEVQFDLFSD